MFDDFNCFVRSLYSARTHIPLHEPVFVGNEKQYINECIDSTYVSSVGEFVDKVERKLADMLGVKHAVMVVNGTAALHGCLMLAGVGHEDEVITQPLTFVATCNAIRYCGAHPVFIDVEQETLGMSPDSLKSFIDHHTVFKKGVLYNRHSQRQIKACLPMHTFGHPCRIEALKEICDHYGLPLIEDAAEGFGSKYKSKSVGGFGQLGAFSFNGNKIITSGGGGAIVTNDAFLAQKAKHLTTTAKISHPWHIAHDQIGYNYRMPNLNAALLLSQLEYFGAILESKRQIAEQYHSFFKNSNFATHLSEPQDARSNFWLNAIQFETMTLRDKFLQQTNEAGIMTRPVWTLMPQLPMYDKAYCSELTQAEQLSKIVVNLPSSARL